MSAPKTRTMFAVGSLIILSLYAADFLVKGKIINGSVLATQFMPVVIRYFNNLKSNIYPFYDFFLLTGMDALGESQQSLLHPVMLLLSLVLSNPIYLITSFLTFHVVLLGIGFYFFALHILKQNTNTSSPEVVAFFVAATQVLSLGLYANFAHHFFVGTMAYLPFVLLFSEKYFLKAKSRDFIFLAGAVSLMILCGNFALQWISLLFVLFYLCGRVYLDSRLFLRAIFISSAVILGFLISMAQLVPTFDLMTVSPRSSGGAGTWRMLLNSAEPLNWLGYFSPGNVFMLFRNDLYWTLTGPHLSEGVHYIGLIPLALLFYSFYAWRENNPETKLFQCLTLLVVLRALGVFSILNVVLNMLPIFGHFRMSVRSFFMLDVAIAMVAAYVLASGIDRRVLRKVLGILALVVVAINLSGLFLVFGFHWLDKPRHISLIECGYVFIGLSVIIAARALLSERFAPFINARRLTVGLILLSVLDLGIHQLGVPSIHKWSDPKVITEQATMVDEYCLKEDAKHVLMTSTWPEYNYLHFPLTDTYGRNYTNYERDKQPELNGISCHLTYYMTATTLAPTSIQRVAGWGETLAEDDRNSLPWLAGFTHSGRFKASDGATGIEISKAEVPSPEALEKFNLFFNGEDDYGDGLFVHLVEPTYETIKRFGFLKHLAQRSIKPRFVQDVGNVIALTAPNYFLMFDHYGQRLHYEMKGHFAVLDHQIEGPVRVVYIPVGFIIGLFCSVLGIGLTLFMAFALNVFIKREAATFLATEKIVFAVRKYLKAGVNLFIQMINSKVFYVRGCWFIILSGIYIVMSYAVSTESVTASRFSDPSFNHPLALIHLFILVWCMYLFVKMATGKTAVSHGAWIFLCINFVVGTVICIFMIRIPEVIGFEHLRFIKRVLIQGNFESPWLEE